MRSDAAAFWDSPTSTWKAHPGSVVPTPTLSVASVSGAVLPFWSFTGWAVALSAFASCRFELIVLPFVLLTAYTLLSSHTKLSLEDGPRALLIYSFSIHEGGTAWSRPSIFR